MNALRKPLYRWIWSALVVILLPGTLVLAPLDRRPARDAALQDPDTPTPSATATATATASATASATATTTATRTPPHGFLRPLIVLESYSTSPYDLSPGRDFDLSFRLRNAGDLLARNIVVTFTAGDFIPRQTGGVIAAGAIAATASTGYTQPMTTSPSVSPGTVGSLPMSVSYTDDEGTAYTGSFTLSIPVGYPSAVHQGPVPTRTPTPGPRPQLLIRAYEIDVPALSPGTQFTLTLNIFNVGGSAARRITMIVGGGASSSGSPGATPGEGTSGLSGASGDYANFAPVGSSNVQFLGDMPADASLQATQALIVNSSTQPGAYPLRISFAYTDERGSSVTDDQVITLLVFSLPRMEISFYSPPDPLMVGQPGILPIQIVNVGRSSAVMGRMQVTAEGADLTNNSMFVGYLDPGGYLSLDASIVAFQPGTLELTATVDYLDDFGQPRSLTQTLTVEVIEGEPIPEGPGFEPTPAPSETFWQKLWRAVLGFLGLDSAQATPEAPTLLGPEGPVPDGGEATQAPVVIPRKG